MPFLRFTRDKRGYETTSLVHSVKRQGRSRHRILYWFRTPPGVKVGRPALDQDAIRWIEEHNPDIEFDWPKILEAKPTAPRPADERKPRRPRRERRERPAVAEKQRLPPPQPDVPQPVPLGPELEEERAAPPEGAVDEEVAEAFEQLTHPDAEEAVEPPSIPVEGTINREELTRLRARYAELQARITERGGEPERIEALRAQAEPLNPDTWVTAEEIRNGLDEFEARIRDLRAALGLRRRRRSRRGGRRRTGGEGRDQAKEEQEKD